ncbi:DHH family phosphoesterase [Halobacterium sp. CBA1126]|uniref:DHH family phosphoesterase n=1 Tax=Halobacterium sp. CBA1126 TaxID=2668074 RepID=UPI0012FA17E8|nr:OB-fold nucleic acid binding domain-containing protein [Halobacterium sp. CBA1126]MUV61499.1 S1 RNA-binding domain-containing protein [Halobacterium sp. CBA1126]
MGTCIICGSSTDGRVCDTHEEDVAFEFRGTSPDELTPGRYYEGTIDGFADFGVFVDIGDSVTGLLHRSEVPGRLDSLGWDAGDEVYVQVTDVHDNDNVDLGWSIRQDDRDFRGHLVDDPSAKTDAELPEDDEEEDAETSTADGGTPVAESEAEFEFGDEAEDGDEEAADAEVAAEPEPEADEAEAAEAEPEPADDEAVETESESEDEDLERVAIADLDDHVGERVAVEGEVANARQTSGPTVFELADESGAVDCAAFVEAGVRAYPDVEAGAVVRIVGEVERRRGELQVETEELTELDGSDAQAVEARMEDALTERAAPESTALLADDPAVEAVVDDLADAATAIRRAVVEARPVIVRHTATVEGYVAGTAIERALLPLIRDEHAREDAEYHYVDRRPLDDAFYTIDDATGDVTSMLEAAERHDEKHPLFVLVGAGSTSESTDAIDLLDIYDADTVAIDGGYTEEAAGADVLVSPTKAGESPVNTGALGSQLAALVNGDVREDLYHLPAVAYWADTPAAYADLAAETDYSPETLADLRDAIALEAFYQSYEDKRELISDLLWGEADDSLISHVSEQFRERLDTELSTAEPHLEIRGQDGVAFETLDVDAYTHQYDFPPVDLLLDALYRQRDRADVLVGVSGDEIRVRSDDAVDVHAVGETVADELPDAGVQPRGARDGRIEFLSGEKDAVVDAVVDAIADQLA